MAEKAILEKQQEPEVDMTAKYVYVLVTKAAQTGKVFNAEGVRIGEPDYIFVRNLLLRSSIIWDGSPDPFTPAKKREKGKHLIRYYDGCTTLFIDDQPKEKEIIEQFMSNTRELRFLNGYLAVYGYDTMLKKYMDWASWNADSPYKVNTVESIYRLMDIEKQMEIEDDILDEVELAMENAKNASDKHMLIHAKFLGLPEVDRKTGLVYSPTAMRTQYRKAAKNDPKTFNKTFNDKTIQIKSWIEQALKVGEISTSIIDNKAVWKNKGAEICDISGIKSHEGILNKLIEFSQSKQGEDFIIQLKALYN